MFDIYISTKQREAKLERCVKAIFANTYKNWRLVIRYNILDEIIIQNSNREVKNMQGDWFLGLSDDTELLPDCLERLDEIARVTFPDTDGVIGLNQINIPDAPQGAIPCTGRKFAERFPNMQIQCPDYMYWNAEKEFEKYARSIGKFIWCSEARLNHYHPSVMPKEMDETHRELRQRTTACDMDVYEKRNAAGLLWGKDFKCLS